MTAPRKSLMRCLGEFAGHIMLAVKKPASRRTEQLRHDTQESRDGDVVLRRTVIEEVEMPADAATKGGDACS